MRSSTSFAHCLRNYQRPDGGFGDAMGLNSWATGALENPTLGVEGLRDALPVKLIATPRDELAICFPTESVAAVANRNVNDFDFFPVATAPLDEAGRIIGLLDLTALKDISTTDALVQDYLTPLSEDNIIGSDANLLTFVSTAHVNRCRLVVSGSKIAGLVTLADLQRLPVRVALFSRVTHLEIIMTDFIERELGKECAWKSRMSAHRLRKLDENIERGKISDTEVEPLLYTQFCDKRNIMATLPVVGAEKQRFRDELIRIEKLRNGLAHANNYAGTVDDAVGVCVTVGAIDKWIGRFS